MTEQTYEPNPEHTARYDALYRRYTDLGDFVEDQLP